MLLGLRNADIRRVGKARSHDANTHGEGSTEGQQQRIGAGITKPILLDAGLFAGQGQKRRVNRLGSRGKRAEKKET
jgi:hypothetical protein